LLPPQQELPWGWIVFLVVLAVGCLSHIFLVSVNVFSSWGIKPVERVAGWLLSRSGRSAQYSIWNDSPFAADRLFFLSAITIDLFIVEYMAVTVSAAVWPDVLRFDRSFAWRLLLPAHAILACCTALCSFALMRRLWRHQIQNNSESHQRRNIGLFLNFLFLCSTVLM